MNLKPNTTLTSLISDLAAGEPYDMIAQVRAEAEARGDTKTVQKCDRVRSYDCIGEESYGLFCDIAHGLLQEAQREREQSAAVGAAFDLGDVVWAGEGEDHDRGEVQDVRLTAEGKREYLVAWDCQQTTWTPESILLDGNN